MENLYLVPSMPGLSITILIILSMIFLFLAREHVHKVIQALSEGTAGGLRKMAIWTEGAAGRMREKDRKVLLESGVASAQEKILQEFHKIESSNTKTLAEYPKLQLKLGDNIAKIEADYKECGQVALEAPGWSEVIESISRVQGSAGDRIIEKMLSEIHKSAVSGEKKALAELRTITSKRHKILSTMAPVWKRLEKTIKEVGAKVELVAETNGRIDQYMTQYQKIIKGGPDSIDMLSSKVTKLFIFSLLIIVVGVIGAFINFNLIALPMSELVPAGTRVAGMAVSEISALVIVALELVLGIFLMEALSITNTFPQIASMTISKRRILLYGSFFGLLFLASVEASLAVLRETLSAAKTTLEHTLAGETAAIADETGSRITVIGQATLGFVLPWILAMIAIPLEMFIEASQHAFARFYTILTTLFGHLANVLAFLIEGFFNVLVHVFDIYIIVPMKIQEMFQGKKTSTKK